MNEPALPASRETASVSRLVKRTLWSLLVGAAAVFPAVGVRADAGPAPVKEAAVPTVAPEAHRVEESREVRGDDADETHDDPAPARADVEPSPAVTEPAPVALAFDAAPEVAPLARRAVRLPPPRAP